MIGAAEKVDFESQTELDFCFLSDDTYQEGPTITLAREEYYERFTKARFDRWRGSLALDQTVELDLGQSKTSLLQNIKLATNPEADEVTKERAINMISANISAAVSEACFKGPHIRRVEAEVDESGQICQFGQTMKSSDTNAIINRPYRHPILQEITDIEALNNHRIEDGLRAGKLKDNYFVAISIVPDEVPEEDLGENGDGYFLDSLTFVIQATTQNTDEQIIIETAFMVGVENGADLDFQERMSKRHDRAVLSRVFNKKLHKEAPTTAAGFLDSALYIPKECMPNGSADVMRWCFESLDELRDVKSNRSEEDYLQILKESNEREKSLEEVNALVLKDMLAQGKKLKDPVDAMILMWQLVKKYTVEESFTNRHIDPFVFGVAAAPYIFQIRHQLEEGNDKSTDDLKQRAHETASVTTCGGGAGRRKNTKESETNSDSPQEDEWGPLTFKCAKGHPNKRPYRDFIDNCKICGIPVRCKKPLASVK